jgi:Condensation domain/Major Facilitator Superfamily
MRALLRDRNLLLLLGSGMISQLGDWTLLLALPLFVYARTHSISSTGALVAAQLVPRLIVSPVAGVLADRWNRVSTLAGADLFRAGVLLILLVTAVGGPIWLVYAVALLEASASQLFVAADGALLPTIVRRENLLRANSLLSLGNSAVHLVGPPAGGLLFALVGLTGSTLVDSASFRVEWAYSRELHRRETVARHAERMLSVLRELIERSGGERPLLVPQDFPLLSLSQEQVDLLLERVPDLEDAYPLTPLQEGMLFHTLADAGSGAYLDQLTFDLDRSLPLDVFDAAWRELVSRHAVLRTAVLWEGLPQPVQVVARDVPFAIERRDWSDRLLQDDRRRGFDLGAAPLMRVTVSNLGGGRQRVLWTVHHLLLDGWSTALVLDELGEIQRALAAGRAPVARARRPFREYVGGCAPRTASRRGSTGAACSPTSVPPTSCPPTTGRPAPATSPRASSPWS